MVAFTALRAASRRVASRQAFATTQKRNMSLGESHGPPPEWEGVDKVVRSYFPHDHQLSAAIIGGYFSLYAIYSISTMGGKKKEETPVVVETASTTPTGAVPDIESPDFEKFLDSEALVKLLDSEEQLKSVFG
mmetsp:Transcript_9765/g.12883  ORF Transcript_9765/g.12883 Transcript_9765/m.12883 type:complete len:133 (+) Transcript_9765:182-580(+)